VVISTPWPLYPRGKSPWYPLNRRLGEPHSQSGCGGEEKNSLPCPCWESNPSHPSHSVVTILSYPGSLLYTSVDEIHSMYKSLFPLISSITYILYTIYMVNIDIKYKLPAKIKTGKRLRTILFNVFCIFFNIIP